MDDFEKNMHTLLDNLNVFHAERPPTSQEEYEAAQHLMKLLAEMGFTSEKHAFYTVSSWREKLGITSFLAGIGILLSLSKPKSARQRLGNIVAVLGTTGILQTLRLKKLFWEGFYPQRRSQNVIVRLMPQGKVSQRIVFLAHLDANPNHTHTQTTSQISQWLLHGLSLGPLIGSVPFKIPKFVRGMIGLGLLAGGMAISQNASEVPLPIGNDNTLGIALLLYVAQTLKDSPLNHTEVIFAFTGSEAAGGSGAEALAETYGEVWKEAWWIVLGDEIGYGDLCWVMEHGIGSTSRYKPHPKAVELMQKTALQNPSVGVVGYPLPILDSVAPLIDKHYKAIALNSYHRSTGKLSSERVFNRDAQKQAKDFLIALITRVDSQHD